MKKLINYLTAHGIESLVYDGKLYGKFIARIGRLSFVQYDEVTEANVRSLLGY
jgi:hypothetical protein